MCILLWFSWYYLYFQGHDFSTTGVSCLWVSFIFKLCDSLQTFWLCALQTSKPCPYSKSQIIHHILKLQAVLYVRHSKMSVEHTCLQMVDRSQTICDELNPGWLQSKICQWYCPIMLSTCKWQHFKAINIPTRLKARLVSIFELFVLQKIHIQKLAFMHTSAS